MEELSPSSSEHVILCLERRVYVPELGRRISSILQLTPDQHASLSNNVIFSINSYMADQPTEAGSGLTHQRGRHQPSKDRDPQFDQEMPDHEVIPEVQTAEASTSQLAQPTGQG